MNGIRRNEISATNVTDSGERKHKEGVQVVFSRFGLDVHLVLRECCWNNVLTKRLWGKKVEIRNEEKLAIMFLKCPFQTFAYYWGSWPGSILLAERMVLHTCNHRVYISWEFFSMYRKKRADCSRRKETGKFEGFENKYDER